MEHQPLCTSTYIYIFLYMYMCVYRSFVFNSVDPYISISAGTRTLKHRPDDAKVSQSARVVVEAYEAALAVLIPEP